MLIVEARNQIGAVCRINIRHIVIAQPLCLSFEQATVHTQTDLSSQSVARGLLLLAAMRVRVNSRLGYLEAVRFAAAILQVCPLAIRRSA